MTTTLQLSDKRGDAILLVKVEVDDLAGQALEQAEAAFAAAAGLVGLGAAYEAFGAAPPATVPAVTQLMRPTGQPAQDPWGVPPVPPMQQPQYQQPAPQQYQQPQQQYQPAPQMPAAAAPVCQHGTKLYREGVSAKNGREWKAWFCPAPGTDPTQCAKEWIR